MKVIRFVNWLSMCFAGVLVIASFSFAYVLLAPIDVLKDWKLHVNPGTYQAGQQITMHATYTKLREVTGRSYYYLECKTPRGSLVRYSISQSEGNRPKGSGQVDIPLNLPVDITGTPATCRIAVSVSYDIYTFRKFVENSSSNYFTVSKE